MSATAPAATSRIPVLIVEDDMATYKVMHSLLEHYGYSASHATTTAQALEMLPGNPRYVFLDLMLPDGDGSRVLEYIRIKQLPITVAVITGTSDPERIKRVERLKPEIMLRKPLDFLTLLDKLRCAADQPPAG